MKNDNLSMFLYYSKVTIKSWFQYKIDATLRSLAVFLRESTGVIVINFTLFKFNNIKGWNVDELMFLFSLLFITYGIVIMFFTGLRDFGFTIQNGSFDRLMLRPRGLLFQVIASNSDWFAVIGHGVLGILLFIISANKLKILWNFQTVIYYILAVIGGVLIQGAIFLLLASFNFYFIKTNSLREIFYWNMRKFACYPISIFHKVIQWILIYLVPFAFVNYFPAQFLLRKDDLKLFWEGCMYITPLVGVIMMVISYYAWQYGLNSYSSTGN